MQVPKPSLRATRAPVVEAHSGRGQKRAAILLPSLSLLEAMRDRGRSRLKGSPQICSTGETLAIDQADGFSGFFLSLQTAF